MIQFLLIQLTALLSALHGYNALGNGWLIGGEWGGA